jgi:RNA polymerase nonessential primary-like sigma factor
MTLAQFRSADPITSHPDAVAFSMGAVARYPLIDHPAEIQYGRKVRAMMLIVEAQGCKLISEADRTGNEQIFKAGLHAREKMLKANLRLVRGMIAKYAHRLTVSFAREDAISEGDMGLLRAIEKFDPEKGYRFSTYATWWIRQAITRAIPQLGRVIRLPIHIVEQRSKIRRALDDAVKDGLTLTPEELRVKARLKKGQGTPENIRLINEASRPVGSLDAEIAPDLSLYNALPSDEDTWDFVLHDEARRQLDELMRAAQITETARALLEIRHGIREITPTEQVQVLEIMPTGFVNYHAAGLIAGGLSREKSRSTHEWAMRRLRVKARELGYVQANPHPSTIAMPATP